MGRYQRAFHRYLEATFTGRCGVSPSWVLTRVRQAAGYRPWASSSSGRGKRLR